MYQYRELEKNLDKNNVENWECEQLYFNEPLTILDDLKHSCGETRWAAFGKTDAGRNAHGNLYKTRKLGKIHICKGYEEKREDFL